MHLNNKINARVCVCVHVRICTRLCMCVYVHNICTICMYVCVCLCVLSYSFTDRIYIPHTISMAKSGACPVIPNTVVFR